MKIFVRQYKIKKRKSIFTQKRFDVQRKSTELIIQCKDIPVNNIIGSEYQNYCKDNDSFFLK